MCTLPFRVERDRLLDGVIIRALEAVLNQLDLYYGIFDKK